MSREGADGNLRWMIAGAALPAAREMIEEHGRKVTTEKLSEAAPRLG